MRSSPAGCTPSDSGWCFAVRDPNAAFGDLPSLRLDGLRDGDARALLSSAVRFKLDRQVIDRIVAETRGNPLALLELPRGLSAAELTGFGTVTSSAPSGAIEESFRRRLAALPAATRQLLLDRFGRAARRADTALARRRAAGRRS